MSEDVLTKEEVIKFFGSRIATAEALGITPQAVSLWGENVPPGRLVHVRLVMKLEAQKRAVRKNARRHEVHAKKSPVYKTGLGYNEEVIQMNDMIVASSNGTVTLTGDQRATQ